MRSLAGIACGTFLLLSPGASAAGERSGAAGLTPAQAEDLVREVSAEVEKLRQLRFKTPVAVKIVDGKTARRTFESSLDDETRERIRHTQNAWIHLGLIPKGTDLVSSHLETAEDEVLGYYEAGSDTFHLLSHVPADEIRPVMAHELTHALGWSLAATDCIGELGLSMLTGSWLDLGSFESILPSRWTTAGASGNAGDVYGHYVNGDQKVTVLLTRWESLRDAERFRENLRGANKKVYTLGVNHVILAGDYGDKSDALAIEATRNMPYWASE